MERGHPVRQRAKPAQSLREILLRRSVRAARSGGQDVRAPTGCTIYKHFAATRLNQETMNHLTPLFAMLFQEASNDRWSKAFDGVKHPDISKFLVIAAILFIIGVAGVLTRRNLLVIFMSIE